MQPETDRESPGPFEPHRAASEDGGRRPDTVQLWEEEVSFDREREETGRVRVRVVTRQHDEAVEVPLATEHVEIERVAIGREVDAIPPRRQDGDTTIVPIVEEVIVTQRKLVLKEELHVRLVRTTEQHRENVTLRRQEAVIERLPAEHPPGEQGPG